MYIKFLSLICVCFVLSACSTLKSHDNNELESIVSRNLAEHKKRVKRAKSREIELNKVEKENARQVYKNQYKEIDNKIDSAVAEKWKAIEALDKYEEDIILRVENELRASELKSLEKQVIGDIQY